MVTSITLKDQERIGQVHENLPNPETSIQGYVQQGRAYYNNHVTEHAAKYPADTWIGSCRLLGWHLEKEQISPQPELDVPDQLCIGASCGYAGSLHKVYAFSDGMALIGNTGGHTLTLVHLSELSDLKRPN